MNREANTGVKYNPQKTKEYTEQKEKLQKELEKLENKEEYIEKVTNQKIDITEKSYIIRRYNRHY